MFKKEDLMSSWNWKKHLANELEMMQGDLLKAKSDISLLNMTKADFHDVKKLKNEIKKNNKSETSDKGQGLVYSGDSSGLHVNEAVAPAGKTRILLNDTYVEIESDTPIRVKTVSKDKLKYGS